ncbi:MAG: aminotransferase class I/II-fold pyridoxal phosphate-dependent enzyme [Marmoricola sp.]|nr:aminotransferase class I/II-fold pyridoxal phosphate-dependent enzyme [Marmoricola sp.]
MNPLEQLTLADLRRRTSIKWTKYDPDVLPLWVAEMDVALAPPVREALERVVREGDTGYPGTASYAEAMASFAEARYGWGGLDPARAVPVADVMTGATWAVELVSASGDAVVVSSPVYPPFYGFIESIGRTVLEVPLRDGRLDLEALGRAFEEQHPAAFLLCSPHNPTGTVHTPAELAEVARLAEASGVRVVVDEIHAPLVLAGAAFTPYLSVPGSDRGFSLMSASKAWNLAGAKAAVLIAGPEAGDDLARLPWVVSHGPSHLGVVAHVAALTQGGEWLDALLDGLARNRQLLVELVEQHLPDVRLRAPAATFLSWLACGALGLGDDPAGVFLERGRVAVNDGREFGTGGAGHVRLNFATSRAILTEAVQRLAASRAR